MKHIPILFTFDNNYVVPALVAFNSFLESADESLGNQYEFIIAHTDISEANKKSIEKLVGRYPFCSLRFVNLEGFLSNEWKSSAFSGENRELFTKETLYRCFASSILPEYDKVLYSDVDVIFKKDISCLWALELKDSYVAGVNLVLFENRHDELEHLKEPHLSQLKNNYLAGGIWLLNCKKIREDNLEAVMLKVIHDETIKKVWNDQDVMNIACAGQVEHIPLRFISYADIKISLGLFGRVINYPMEEVYELFFDPTIIHYAAFKPWKLHSARLFEWWAEYDKIREYVNDFGCYRVSRKKKLLFSFMRFIYKKLRFSRFFEITSS